MTKFKPTTTKCVLVTNFETKKAFVGKTHIHYFMGNTNISNEPIPSTMDKWEVERCLKRNKWELGQNLSKNYRLRNNIGR